MDPQTLTLELVNTLELHYLFNDDSHDMDALVQNKCEFEFLWIIKEVAKTFDIEITIETEPLAEGGIRRWFKVASKSEKKNATITVAVIASLVTAIVVTPISSAISKSTEILIDRLFEDEKEKQKDNEKDSLEIENLKLDLELKKQQLANSPAIAKRKSNFYETLEKYPKIKNITLTIEDNHKNPVDSEKVIPKNSFKEFILVSDKLEPIIKEDAVIEIISPVLKKGKYLWRGIYEGETISFYMKSNEFKTLVQTAKIEFKNGSSIRCQLEIERKINNEGTEQITNYNIIRVDEYFENDKPIETPEGRLHRQRKAANDQQFDLFKDY